MAYKPFAIAAYCAGALQQRNSGVSFVTTIKGGV